MGDAAYKRCLCRDDTGRELGARCPKLRRKDGSWNPNHGSWYFALELPRGQGGRRRPRMRRGGFDTRDEALKAREIAKATLGRGIDPSVRLTVGQFLTDWLTSRVDLKPTTRRNYTFSINTYLIPLIGHIELGRLRPEQVAEAFATIRQWNEQLAEGKPVRKFQRHVGPAAMQRIRAVLRSALKDAMASRLIDFNPAGLVRMPVEGDRRPLTWTSERVRAFQRAYEQALAAAPGGRGDKAFTVWRTMALRPGPVMVWTPEDTGKFLDHVSGHRLAPLFEMVALTGMRRGEICGLRWQDVDLESGQIRIVGARVQVGWEVAESTPKSEAGKREFPVDAGTVAVLKAWRLRQRKERFAWGDDWIDSGGLVFTRENGEAWHPDAITDTFERLAFAGGLPPVRLHDLRHGHITYLLAQKIDPRVIGDRVGHSGTKMTRDYAAVLSDVAQEAADLGARVIPRGRRRDAR